MTTDGVDKQGRWTVLTNNDNGRCRRTVTTDGVDKQGRRTVLTNSDDGNKMINDEDKRNSFYLHSDKFHQPEILSRN